MTSYAAICADMSDKLDLEAGHLSHQLHHMRLASHNGRSGMVLLTLSNESSSSGSSGGSSNGDFAVWQFIRLLLTFSSDSSNNSSSGGETHTCACMGFMHNLCIHALTDWSQQVCMAQPSSCNVGSSWYCVVTEWVCAGCRQAGFLGYHPSHLPYGISVYCSQVRLQHTCILIIMSECM